MTPPAPCVEPSPRLRDPLRLRAEQVLAEHDCDVTAIPGVREGGEAEYRAGLATGLMDLYRRTGSREVFDCLVALVAPHLQNRVRSRLRHLAPCLDPAEVFQDAIVNIYRYPDRFDPCRAGAFAAWSSTIVDNTIRRQLRRLRTGPDIALSPAEILAQHPDAAGRTPFQAVQDGEDCRRALTSFRLFLSFYLLAFEALSERERFVLQMVEVRQMRYAELAEVLGVRPEALKMVVFRARKRIHDRLVVWLGSGRRAA